MNQPTLEEFKMDGQCASCRQPTTVSMNEFTCAKCGHEHDLEVIKEVVEKQYNAIYNNKFHKVGRVMTSTGEGMQQVGNSMSSIGCGMFTLAIVVIIILFLLT